MIKINEKFVAALILVGMLLERGEGRPDHNALNLHLEIPKYPRVGERLVLGCKYELGSEALYTVKWYKGIHEFYRYTPKESPKVKTFKLPGGDVDINNSNGTHLAIRRADLGLNGKYSCEVTTDSPNFLTDMKSESLTVVAFPNTKPDIGYHKQRYAAGEHMDINCTSYGTKPAANLSWYINQTPAHLLVNQNIEKTKSRDNSEISRLRLRFLIQPSHFSSGRIDLKCTASMYDRYFQSNEVTILEDDRPKLSSVVDNSSSQPHPHSTKNSSTSNFINFNMSLHLLLPTFLYLFLIHSQLITNFF